MSQFTLQQDVLTKATRIPNCFIEKYMPKAAGEFVKIYIYLLKCVEENRFELSTSKIADALDDSEKDVIRALKYWEKKGLLKLTFEDGIITSLHMTSFAERNDDTENITVNVSTTAGEEKAKKEVQEAPVAAKQAPSAKTPAKKQYTPGEVAAFSQNEDVTMLLYGIQKYMEHSLSGSDVNTIFFFYETLGFPVDLIEYLFEYCISKGHKNMRYIEKTALNWAEEGITSLHAAKVKTSVYAQNSYPIMRAFGLSDRNPSKGEAEWINKWTLSYGFSLELILEAVNRTMNKKHEPSFEYTDGILRHWKANGAFSLEAVKPLDEQWEASSAKDVKTKKEQTPRKKSTSSTTFDDFDQRTYDWDEIEEKLYKV